MRANKGPAGDDSHGAPQADGAAKRSSVYQDNGRHRTRRGPRPDDTVEEAFYRGFAIGWLERSRHARACEQTDRAAYVEGLLDGFAELARHVQLVEKSG